MMSEFVELTAGEFKAVVVPFRFMPVQTILPILSEPDSMQQFAKTIELLRDQVAVDVRSSFDLLPMDQMILLVSAWVASGVVNG